MIFCHWTILHSVINCILVSSKCRQSDVPDRQKWNVGPPFLSSSGPNVQFRAGPALLIPRTIEPEIKKKTNLPHLPKPRFTLNYVPEAITGKHLNRKLFQLRKEK